MSRKINKYELLPIYQKAKELTELASVIADALKESDVKDSLAMQMCSNAVLIQAKIAGAEGARLYSLRMQNAVLIKLAVQDMFNAVVFSSMVDISEEDYADLMRIKVEEFRLIFVDWIRGFNTKHDIPDNWGIRYSSSTPEQEKLEEMMFDEDMFDDDDEYFNDNGDEKE